MSTVNNPLLFEQESAPSEIVHDFFHLLLELLFPKQPSDVWHGVIEFKRIHKSVDQCSAQWMIHHIFEEIPPRMELMLPPENDFAE